MAFPNQQRRGSATGGVILVLLLCGALAAIYFLVLKKPTDAAEPAVEVAKEEADTASKEVVEVVDEEEVEPEPEPEDEAVEVVKENPEAARKKALVDRYLARKFPFQNVTTADEITFGWRSIPEKLFPAKVQVNVSRVYKNKSKTKNQYVADGHFATVEKVIDDKLVVRSVDHSDLTCVVLMAKTDFQEQITKAHDAKFDAHRQEVLAKREAFREEAYAILARNEARRAEAKAEAKLAAENAAKNPESKSSSSFESKQYGKAYRGDYWEEPRNGKDRKDGHEVPMGPICGVADVMYDKREAVIISLWEEGPGVEAGLAEGDVITKINGKSFPKYENTSYAGGVGFPEALGFAMIEAQENRKPVVLTVKRAGEQLDIEVDLPYLPEFAANYPEDCSRSEAMSKAAAKYLDSVANDDGALPTNDYTNAWYGLALLSSNDKKNARAAKKLARYFAEKYELGKRAPKDKFLFGPHKEDGDGMKAGSWHWDVAGVGMFLAEYYLATGDKTVFQAMMDCSRSMEIRMDQKNGRFGHKGGEYPLPYGNKGLVIINVQAHILWALAAHVEGLDKWDWSYWDKSKEQVYAAQTDDHAVGYSDIARGGQQSACRTGAMMTALNLAEKESKKRRNMGKWLYENNKNFPDVHAMTYIGPMLGFTGMRNLSDDKYDKVMQEYRWFWSLLQPANFDNGVLYYSDRHNSGGDNYCNKRVVGNIMTLFCLNSHRNDALWMHGNRKKNWFK